MNEHISAVQPRTLPKPVGFSNYEFVVWVVGQPDEICAQLPGPTEQRNRILTAVRASATKRRLLV